MLDDDNIMIAKASEAVQKVPTYEKDITNAPCELQFPYSTRL